MLEWTEVGDPRDGTPFLPSTLFLVGERTVKPRAKHVVMQAKGISGGSESLPFSLDHLYRFRGTRVRVNSDLLKTFRIECPRIFVRGSVSRCWRALEKTIIGQAQRHSRVRVYWIILQMSNCDPFSHIKQ
jgi:hypothetical protein